MSPEDIQRLLEQNRQDTGQRLADITNTYKQAPSMADDPEVQAREAQRNDKIKQLYDHDKNMATTYANPQSNVYLEDPYEREKARAIQNQATAGEILGINSQIQNRKDTLTEAMDKAMKLAQYGIQAKQLEQQALQQELENSLKLKQVGQSDQDATDLQSFIKALTNNGSTNTSSGSGVDTSNPLVSGISNALGMNTGVGDSNQPLDQDAVRKLLLNAVAKNPRIYKDATDAANNLALSKTDYFGYTPDESAAGVAGLPRNQETQGAYNIYQAQKQSKQEKADQMQIIQQNANWLQKLLGIGDKTFQVNKNQGTVKQIQGGPGSIPLLSGVGEGLGGLLGLLSGGNNNKPPLSSFDQ